jgi:serine/threonine-protein kinase RsbW
MILELQATPEEVMRAVETFQQLARARQVPEATVFGFSLALEECCSNIVNHALRRDARQKFRVNLDCTETAISAELRDSGPGFNPNTVAGRKPRAEDGDEPGGWGIQLARHYTDEIHYQREENENVLLLLKRLPKSPG